MGIAHHGEQTYTVALAETPSERAAVYALREETYAGAQDYLLAPKGAPGYRAFDAYDDRSYVFACYANRDRDPIATCRFTMPVRGRWELDELVDQWMSPPVPVHKLVETSRVVIRADARTEGLAEAMLLMAGTWLLDHTGYRYNFAVCARPLVRLYARLGMKLVSDTELLLDGRPPSRRYVVIYGDMMLSRPAVVARLAAKGWAIDDGETRHRKAGT